MPTKIGSWIPNLGIWPRVLSHMLVCVESKKNQEIATYCNHQDLLMAIDTVNKDTGNLINGDPCSIPTTEICTGFKSRYLSPWNQPGYIEVLVTWVQQNLPTMMGPPLLAAKIQHVDRTERQRWQPTLKGLSMYLVGHQSRQIPGSCCLGLSIVNHHFLWCVTVLSFFLPMTGLTLQVHDRKIGVRCAKHMTTWSGFFRLFQLNALKTCQAVSTNGFCHPKLKGHTDRQFTDMSPLFAKQDTKTCGTAKQRAGWWEGPSSFATGGCGLGKKTLWCCTTL